MTGARRNSGSRSPGFRGRRIRANRTVEYEREGPISATAPRAGPLDMASFSASRFRRNGAGRAPVRALPPLGCPLLWSEEQYFLAGDLAFADEDDHALHARCSTDREGRRIL